MVSVYTLKIVEYSFYGLPALASIPLVRADLATGRAANDITAVVFILIGAGILLPRAIAYMRWEKVIARVGSYNGTWDGEQSATYSYEVDNQRYAGSFRTMYGTAKLPRLQVCVNPAAPWVRYPVFANVLLCGVAFVASGLFLLLSEKPFFG